MPFRAQLPVVRRLLANGFGSGAIVYTHPQSPPADMHAVKKSILRNRTHLGLVAPRANPATRRKGARPRRLGGMQPNHFNAPPARGIDHVDRTPSASRALSIPDRYQDITSLQHGIGYGLIPVLGFATDMPTPRRFLDGRGRQQQRAELTSGISVAKVLLKPCAVKGEHSVKVPPKPQGDERAKPIGTFGQARQQPARTRGMTLLDADKYFGQRLLQPRQLTFGHSVGPVPRDGDMERLCRRPFC